LFVSPIVRIKLEYEEVSYSFEIALLFMFIFLVAGKVSTKRKCHTEQLASPLLMSLHGTIIVTLWAVLYSVLSMEHGLINRRIGTNEAALLFSSIPIFDLAAFRIFELLLPFIIAHLIVKKIKFNLDLADKILAVCLIPALALSGLAFSRSQTFFLLACSAIILQNSLTRREFSKLLMVASMAAVFAFVLVSVYRVTFSPVDSFSAHFSDEILKRVDGLELISLLVETYGYQSIGINPSSIAAPVLSSIPFLPAAVELKASASTTIKSIILALEFGSLQGDTNSFAIVDAYYWGGFIGLMFSAAFLGYAAKRVDQRILISKSVVTNSLFIALACNVIYLEREFISILIGTVRDFVIYTAIFFVCCRKNNFEPNNLVAEESSEDILVCLKQQGVKN